MATTPLDTSLSKVLSLPRELLQTVLSSIANFEPWTYSSKPTHTHISTDDGDPTLLPLGEVPRKSNSINRSVIGLSSENSWLVNILSLHPYHLMRRESPGISSAVAQAVGRMNAHIEQEYWDLRLRATSLQVSEHRPETKLKHDQPASLQDEQVNEDFTGQKPRFRSMKPYHATIQNDADEPTRQVFDEFRVDRNDAHMPSPVNALVLYSPAPVLKLSYLDMLRIAHQHKVEEASKDTIPLLTITVAVLAQCCLDPLKALEEVERDTPMSSVESCGIKDFAAPETSPRPDRTRSLSGSTIAETLPHEAPLSFSAISTVCDLSDEPKRVRSAEKRVTDEGDTDVMPKRPKLSDYKQVSSGRVATLMDRFERFHL